MATSFPVDLPTKKAAVTLYCDLGWSVITLYSPDHHGMPNWHTDRCGSPGKCPIGKWRDSQFTRLPASAVHNELSRYPGTNIGVVFGHVSGIIGIDMDGWEGEQILFDLAEKYAPGQMYDQNTYQFETSPGRCRWIYSIPNGHPAPTIPLRHEDGREIVKILGLGSQSVMPPSIHPSGTKYRWLSEQSPDEILILPAPAWLLKFLEQHQHVKTPVDARNPNPKFDSDNAKIVQYSGPRNLDRQLSYSGGPRRWSR